MQGPNLTREQLEEIVEMLPFKRIPYGDVIRIWGGDPTKANDSTATGWKRIFRLESEGLIVLHGGMDVERVRNPRPPQELPKHWQIGDPTPPLRVGVPTVDGGWDEVSPTEVEDRLAQVRRQRERGHLLELQSKLAELGVSTEESA
jgi:hypothetical protein